MNVYLADRKSFEPINGIFLETYKIAPIIEIWKDFKKYAEVS